MAFVKEDFKPGDSTGNAPAIHVYKTNDTAAVVNAADYFLDIYQVLEVGDVIYIAGDQDGTPFYDFRAVSASSSSTVTTDTVS
mgnify:CR=1 FL=1